MRPRLRTNDRRHSVAIERLRFAAVYDVEDHVLKSGNCIIIIMRIPRISRSFNRQRERNQILSHLTGTCVLNSEVEPHSMFLIPSVRSNEQVVLVLVDVLDAAEISYS